MRASDLIEFLQLAIEKHGDLEVSIAGYYSGDEHTEAGTCDKVTDILHWRGEFLLWPFSSYGELSFAPLESVRLGKEVTEEELRIEGEQGVKQRL